MREYVILEEERRILEETFFFLEYCKVIVRV